MVTTSSNLRSIGEPTNQCWDSDRKLQSLTGGVAGRAGPWDGLAMASDDGGALSDTTKMATESSMVVEHGWLIMVG